MAVNPLIPYTDTVSGDPTAGLGGAPAGVQSAASSDPSLVPGGMSPAMAALWAPEPEPVVDEYSGTDAADSTDSDGDGEDDHFGVPLPLSPLPGAPAFPPPGSNWREQTAPPPTGGPVSRQELLDAEATLTPEQLAQRELAIKDADRIDALQADAKRAQALAEAPPALSAQAGRQEGGRGDRRQGRIEPNYVGRTNDKDNFVERYVNRLRDAWRRNDTRYEGVERDRMEQARSSAPAPASPEFVSDDPDMARKVIHTARDFVGMPHRWGGDSYGGADDLGVVRAAYRAADKELPMVLDPELFPGKRVKLSRIRPGDVVLWRDDEDPSGNTRIGVFIGGDEVVTSSKRRGVSVRNLSDLNDPSGRRVRRRDDNDDDGDGKGSRPIRRGERGEAGTQKSGKKKKRGKSVGDAIGRGARG